MDFGSDVGVDVLFYKGAKRLRDFNNHCHDKIDPLMSPGGMDQMFCPEDDKDIETSESEEYF